VVTDRRGHFVPGLRRDNFQVFEDDEPQTIAAFIDEDLPMTIALVVDNSESMRGKYPQLMEIAWDFLDYSNPRDNISIFSVNDRPSQWEPTGPSFGRSATWIQAVVSLDRTALYDTVLSAMEQLKTSTTVRKSLVLISDGDDNASHVSLQSLISVARTNSILIYALGLCDLGQTGSNPTFMEQLASTTGGKAKILNSMDEFPGIGRSISRELHQQYTLVYASSNPKPSGVFRTVRVTARSAEFGKLFVRTRPGYTAQNHPESRYSSNTMS
jgi:Ca-activated chloride channel homolog